MNLKTNDISINKMNLHDLKTIETSLLNYFDYFWNSNILKQEIESDSSTIYTLKINDKIVGFAGISIVLDEADITNIVIKKNCRGQKLSFFLMAILIDLASKSGCKKINLEVNEKNIIAINLYKKFGFEQVGLRKKYYNDQDAVLMSKVLC